MIKPQVVNDKIFGWTLFGKNSLYCKSENFTLHQELLAKSKTKQFFFIYTSLTITLKILAGKTL